MKGSVQDLRGCAVSLWEPLRESEAAPFPSGGKDLAGTSRPQFVSCEEKEKMIYFSTQTRYL